MDEKIVQGSPEWTAARCGSIGATAIPDAMMKAGTAGRRNLISRVVCEKLTNVTKESFQSWQMEQGIIREPLARGIYEFNNSVTVELVGLVRHPTLIGTHSSPDGLVEKDGGVEIKCPEASAHIFDHVLSDTLPTKYVTQMQWFMACTGRKWCDFISYCPDLPVEMQYYEERVLRDEEAIKTMEQAVKIILDEIEVTIKSLREKIQ